MLDRREYFDVIVVGGVVGAAATVGTARAGARGVADEVMRKPRAGGTAIGSRRFRSVSVLFDPRTRRAFQRPRATPH